MASLFKQILVYIHEHDDGDGVNLRPLFIRKKRGDILSSLNELKQHPAKIIHCGSTDPYQLYLEGEDSSEVSSTHRRVTKEIPLIYRLTLEGEKIVNEYSRSDSSSIVYNVSGISNGRNVQIGSRNVSKTRTKSPPVGKKKIVETVHHKESSSNKIVRGILVAVVASLLWWLIVTALEGNQQPVTGKKGISVERSGTVNGKQ